MKAPKILPLLSLACSVVLAAPTALRAADHGDAPTLGPDQGCDLADVYAFLDPNNNDRVVLIGTVRGFIVPGEANNFGLFDPTARFTLAIENTGDPRPDLFIDLDFSPRVQNPDKSFSQDAEVSFRGAVPTAFRGAKGKFNPAPVTQPTLAATPNPQVVTFLNNDFYQGQASGIQFFAGEVDDPFFFDIPGFNRFVAAVIAGTPNPQLQLDRGRDTFAGYNVLGFALSMPATVLRGDGTKIGVSLISARTTERTVKGVKVPLGVFRNAKGRTIDLGVYSQVDRMGNPGVNVAFIPYNRKNAYNGASPLDDAKGMFLPEIAGTLTALHTSLANIKTLASVVGLPPNLVPTNKPAEFGTGDFLRLETDKTKMPNVPAIGTGGGSGVQFEDATVQNPAHGFPNGRRLRDDVIDTVLFVVSNGGITKGDNVDASDVPTQDTFPFLALPQQPRASGIDDGTRN
ncbi:MAG: hypothetical protein QOE70_2798 [Chthoniobacter sp.]|jgi:hypothetical protein|nr:hypothetical protein [Chthoniobacter sp.]